MIGALIVTHGNLAHELLNAAQQIAHVGSWERIYSVPDSPDEDAFIWSDEFFRIFGFEPQQFTPSLEMLYGAIHPDDREAVAKAMSASSSGSGVTTEALRSKTSRLQFWACWEWSSLLK